MSKNNPKIVTKDPAQHLEPGQYTDSSKTLRYLGTDKKERARAEGKFATNVLPKNFGKNLSKTEDERADWGCDLDDCPGNPYYYANCPKCFKRRPV